MLKIDKEMQNLIIECLKQVRSYYGRTVEQSFDGVPLEDWEHSAIIILKYFEEKRKHNTSKMIIQPEEINVKRMLSYD